MKPLRPYSNYKNSNDPCIRLVPRHWNERKLRHCGRIVGGSTPSMGRPDFWNGDIPWISPKDMKSSNLWGSINGITETALSETSIQAYDPPAVLMVVRGMILARRVPIAVTHVKAAINQDMKAIIPSPHVNAHFLLHALEASNDRLMGLTEESGHGTKRLPTERWRDLRLHIPPPDEQAAIVRFLDHVDRKIRRFIQAKRRQIDLFSEQRHALLSEVLPDEGRDQTSSESSDWTGRQYDTWKVGHFARVGNGSTPSRSNINYWSDGDFPWLNSSTVNQGVITRSDQFVTSQALKECHLPIVPPGSVLMAITGQGKTRGTSALLAMEATINQHLAFITIKKPIVTPAYLHAALTAMYRRLRAMSDDSGSTKGALTCTQIRHLSLPIPPPCEQSRILDDLSMSTAKINRLSTQAEAEIKLLQEYRTRLISDVVTGKLDVREDAEHLPEDLGTIDSEDDYLGSDDEDSLDDDSSVSLSDATDKD
ncbi:restriction endonuclease subunit S [Paludisphaera sp.]|uniref:restriction endonuclease subunit S n=1 Tax=Paludisphaera sp. TaxID=2017432 RepID=UPI00301D2D99